MKPMSVNRAGPVNHNLTILGAMSVIIKSVGLVSKVENDEW